MAVTIAVNAIPSTKPTATSTTLPRLRKSRNSCNTWIPPFERPPKLGPIEEEAFERTQDPRTSSRRARRSSAATARRFCSAVSAGSGGTGTGLPCSSTPTMVKNAVVVS